MSGASADRPERRWTEIVAQLAKIVSGQLVDIRSYRIVTTADEVPSLPSVSSHVRFIDCEFSSESPPAAECRFRQTVFEKPIEFYRCHFYAPVFMADVRFCQGLRFEQCEFHHNLNVVLADDQDFAGIEFVDSQLKNVFLRVRSPVPDSGTQSDSRRPVFIRVNRSSICGEVLLQVPPRFRYLDLKSCVFEATSSTKIEFSDSPELRRYTVSLNGSYIAGSIAAKTNDGSANLKLDLAQATVTGSITFDKVRLAELDLNVATLHGGELKLPLIEHFTMPTRWERFRTLSTLDYDRSGPLQREIKKSSAPESGRLQDLVDQYTELRDSYARLGNRSTEYDICAYKVRSIETERQRQLLAEATGNAVGAEGFFAVIVALALSSLLFVVPSPFWLRCSLSLFAALAAILLWRRYLHHKTMWLQCLFQTTVLRWCFHYGIRLRYSVRTALIAILWFALLFALSTVWQPQVGAVTSEDEKGQVVDLCGRPWTPKAERQNIAPWELSPHLANVFPNALYYSTVTFTTLGYGDFQPQGRLRLVAAIEAILGLLMGAMITVVFARRYLRL